MSMLNNKEAKYENMYGEAHWYQPYARKALPIVVKAAIEKRTINFGDLADAIKYGSPRKMGAVCGSISKTIYQIEKDWGERIPRLTAVVIKSTGNPGAYLLEMLTEKLKRKPTTEDYKNFAIQPVFEYSKWNAVLEAVYKTMQL